MTDYKKRIIQRSSLRYYLGLISRTFLYLKYATFRNYAKLRNAQIGANSIISWKLAKRANKNLHIGANTICEAYDLDLRAEIEIGDNIVINKEVSIIRVSHYIDNNTEFSTRYYPKLQIQSYSWLATGCKILPSCTLVAEGSVVGAYAVLHKDTSPNGVYGGNPAVYIRTHNTKFKDLVIPSLMGGDLKTYYWMRNMNK